MFLTLFHNLLFDLFIAFLTLIFVGLTYIATVRNQPETYGPFDSASVLVIVPCRGMDYSLEENLKSIKRQQYRDFKVLAVVDSEDDEAVPAIEKAGIEFTISSDDCTACSGKVRAISTAFEKEKGYDIYVIADSDILVRPDWLLKLVSPFQSQHVGISTTVPYFYPVGGFWSKVKLVWGFVGLGMMESRLTRFGWGGSVAFRKEMLVGENLEFFRTYVSDDIALTKICKNLGYSIAYVREAMPRVNSPDDFKTFIEWANRQTALSVYSTRNVLTYGLLFYGAQNLLFISTIILGILVAPIFFIFLAPMVINSSRSVKRAGNWPVWSFAIGFLIPFLYFYNLVKAARMEKISWRGREYPLK